ncbi:hypothetical protein [Desulfatiglans anilini]|uniref:hypothetical protein n=1 Tax=Desulfatiglans anilini TaxID=90728 RepID=UPI0004012AD8|nr:hypothetical protein [Desulfatiglans anilini]
MIRTCRSGPCRRSPSRRRLILRSAALRLLPLLVLAAILLQRPAPSAASAQGHAAAVPPEPALEASLDRSPAAFGTRITLTLHTRLPAGARLPTPPRISGLEGLTECSRRIEADRITLTFLVDQLDTWRTGPLRLDYEDADGTLRTLSAPPASAEVLSVLGGKPEEAQPRPIAGIIPGRAAWMKALPWAGAALALAALGAGLVWWLRKRRYRDIAADVLPPPHVRALADLQALAASGLYESGAVKAFYFRLSEVVRRYVEDIRGFPAAEMTTEEIARQPLSTLERDLLPLLRQADLAKFAGHRPTPAAKEAALEAVQGYIHQTSPAPEATP